MCRISWTATSTHKNEFSRGDGERGRHRTFSEENPSRNRKGRLEVFSSLRGVHDACPEYFGKQSIPNLRLCKALRSNPGFLKKSSNISSIFFIETKCRISWTATGLSRKKILRGDGEEWTATSTHKNEFSRGDGREGSKFPSLRGVRISVFARSPRRLPGVFREAIQDSISSRHLERRKILIFRSREILHIALKEHF